MLSLWGWEALEPDSCLYIRQHLVHKAYTTPHLPLHTHLCWFVLPCFLIPLPFTLKCPYQLPSLHGEALLILQAKLLFPTHPHTHCVNEFQVPLQGSKLCVTVQWVCHAIRVLPHLSVIPASLHSPWGTDHIFFILLLLIAPVTEPHWVDTQKYLWNWTGILQTNFKNKCSP